MKKTLIPFAALALTLAGCSNEETSSSSVPEGTPIIVNAVTGEMQTKAGYDPNTQPTKFYLNVVNESRPKFSYYVQMQNDNTAWKSFDPKDGITELPMYWAGDGNSVKVTAATFDFRDSSTGNPTTAVALSAATDQSDDDKLKACDHLMHLTTTAEPNTAGISVTLKHIMAKITVTLDLGSDETRTDNPVTDFIVGGTNLTRTYDFSNVENAAWKDAGTTTNVDDIAACPCTYTPANANGQKATASYEAIVVPQDVDAGKLTVCFNVDGKSYQWQSASNATLNPNMRYTLSLKLHGDVLAMNTLSIEDWGQETSLGDGTVAEAEQSKYKFVDLGLSVLWAETNIGATKPADVGNYFAWGETDTKEDYSQSTYSYYDSSNNAYYKYTSSDGLTVLEEAEDAAYVKWGASYRMPTNAELQELDYYCTQTMTTQENSSGTSVEGWEFKSNKNSKSIFLPMTGVYKGTTIEDGSTTGCYWSSTVSPDNWGYFLRLEKVYSQYNGVASAMRFLGVAIRPVKQP